MTNRTAVPYTTLGQLIVDTEDEVRDNAYELDAGEIVYFNAFVGDWVPLVGR